MPDLTFIDANVLFRMFAVSATRLERYRSQGTSGSKALDYAISTLLSVGDAGGYATSELALLEACGVASREGGEEKSVSLLKATLEQEGMSILGMKALAYPLAFTFILEHEMQARDALHLGIAVISKVDRIVTSDGDFADCTEALVRQASNTGIRIPRIIEQMYGLSEDETRLIERSATTSLSRLKVERAPS